MNLSVTGRNPPSCEATALGRSVTSRSTVAIVRRQQASGVDAIRLKRQLLSSKSIQNSGKKSPSKEEYECESPCIFPLKCRLSIQCIIVAVRNESPSNRRPAPPPPFFFSLSFPPFPRRSIVACTSDRLSSPGSPQASQVFEAAIASEVTL